MGKNKKKNICFVIDNISNIAGSERVCCFVADSLCDLYNVHILTFKYNKSVAYKVDSRIKIYHIPFANFKIFENNWWLYTRYFAAYSMFLYWLKRMDVVIDVMLDRATITYSAVKKLHCKYIIWDHFNYYYNIEFRYKIKLLEYINNGFDAFVVLTNEDKEAYKNSQLIDCNKIKRIYNPVTIQNQKYTDTSFNKKVLAIGRFVPQKGFDLLLRAWKIVEKYNSSWSLEIWGNANGNNTFIHDVYNELNLQRVSLCEQTLDVEKLYKEAGIYILSSRFEGFVLVLLEAMHSSLPVISYDCDFGPKELIDNCNNGILVEPENIQKLAEAILTLINDDDYRKKLSYNAYMRSKDFMKEKIIPQWIDLIESFF